MPHSNIVGIYSGNPNHDDHQDDQRDHEEGCKELKIIENKKLQQIEEAFAAELLESMIYM